MTKYDTHLKGKDECSRNRARNTKRVVLAKNKIFKRISIKSIDNPVLSSIIAYNETKGNNVTPFTDDKVIKRITLNTMRHQFTNYDKLINQLKMDRTNLINFKNYVNAKIFEKYGENFIDDELTELRISCLI